MAFKNRDLEFSVVELKVKRNDKREIFTVNNDLVAQNMEYLRARFLNLRTTYIRGQIVPCCQGLHCASENV